MRERESVCASPGLLDIFGLSVLSTSATPAMLCSTTARRQFPPSLHGEGESDRATRTARPGRRAPHVPAPGRSLLARQSPVRQCGCGSALEGLDSGSQGRIRSLRAEAVALRGEALGVSFRPKGLFLRTRELLGGRDNRWHTELVALEHQYIEARHQVKQVAEREAEARQGAEA